MTTTDHRGRQEWICEEPYHVILLVLELPRVLDVGDVGSVVGGCLSVSEPKP